MGSGAAQDMAAGGTGVKCRCKVPAPSFDPRKGGRCVRCRGQVQAYPPLGERNVEQERAFTRQAGQVIGRDVEDLIAVSELRAGTGPVSGLPRRSLIREGYEEMADARNYIVWRIKQEYDMGDPDGTRIAHLLNALQGIILAWDELRRAARGQN